MIDAGQDPAEIKNRVLAYLSANPKTDAVLTLGPTSADPTLLALKENGMAGDIYFGTFAKSFASIGCMVLRTSILRGHTQSTASKRYCRIDGFC